MKVTITLKDNEDGSVSSELDFEPAVTSDMPQTMATRAAMFMLDQLRQRAAMTEVED